MFPFFCECLILLTLWNRAKINDSARVMMCGHGSLVCVGEEIDPGPLPSEGDMVDRDQ